MKSGRTLSLAVLFAINLLNFYDRHVPGALTEPVRKEFGLTDSQVGLMGSAFIWVYAIIGIPLGRVADVWSRRKLLGWGVAIWSAMTAASGLAVNFTSLLVPRMGVGVGEAQCPVRVRLARLDEEERSDRGDDLGRGKFQQGPQEGRAPRAEPDQPQPHGPRFGGSLADPPLGQGQPGRGRAAEEAAAVQCDRRHRLRLSSTRARGGRRNPGWFSTLP